MGKPNESLDDYVAKRARETAPEPPRGVSPELADDPKALEDGEVSEPAANTFLLWVHRFVAVGSVLALIAFILLGALSAFLIVIGEPATERNATTNGRPAGEPETVTNIDHADEPEATTDDQYADEPEATTNGQYADDAELMTNGRPPDEQTQNKEPLSFFSASNSARVNIARSNARPRRWTRPRRLRPRIRVAGYGTRRSPRWHPQPLEPLFIPTTLVIYVDNGVIKTRIEPWLQSTATPNN